MIQLLYRGGLRSNMYTAIETACAIVNYANQIDNPMSNLKLQKVLYFVQGYYLQMTGNPFFGDEIEAWRYGPVVPNVYEQFQTFGSSFIPYIHEYSVIDETAWNETILFFSFDDFSPNDLNFLKAVVKKLNKYSASDLVTITHKQDPWRLAVNSGNCSIISKESIKRYFDKRSRGNC